jgi:G3E family GTPase
VKKNSRAFVNQLLVCLLVSFAFGGSTGMAVVWMRHQISVTANHNRELAAQIAAVDRLIKEKTTTVESELRADLLRQLNQDMRIGLVPMNEVHVEHMIDDPLQKLMERVYRDFSTDVPVQVTFKVAQR